MEMDTNKTERQNCQITPFNFFVAQNSQKDWSVRIVLIENVPWFAVTDVGHVLGHDNVHGSLRNFPETDRRLQKTPTAGGWQEMVVINEIGLCRFVFQSRKSESEEFKIWVLNDLLPQVRTVCSIPSKKLSFFCRLYHHFRTFCKMSQKTLPCDRPGFPLELPAKEAANV